MALNWDDDDEEDLTEADYRRRPSRVLEHEEVTTPFGSPLEMRRPLATAPAATPAPPPVQAPLPAPSPKASRSGFMPASLRDRFAAFLIDSLLALYTYSLVGYFLNRFFNTPNVAVLHQNAGRFGIHVGLSVGVVFFYYILMESTVGATLGKLFCRLRVQEENGENASLGNVFIRNLLRLVDYPLGFLVAVIAMESSPLHQRLGDRAAKTLVIKKTRRYLPAVDLTHTPLASTLSRLFAEAIDLVIAVALIYGVLLFMRPSAPYFSYLLFVSTPVVFVAYYTLLEFLTGSTPGKALFQRRVVIDNGEPPDGTAAFIRNLFRPLDYLLGYPLMILSKKKQRLGDMAADTLVVAKSAGARALWGSLLAVAFVALLIFAGARNPNSFVRSQYGLNPLLALKGIAFGSRPQNPTSGNTGANSTAPKKNPEANPTSSRLPATTSDKLKLDEFYFATGPAPGQIRHDKQFRSGDLIFAFFKILGFELNSEKQAQLSEDLLVEDPQGKVIVSEINVVSIERGIDPAAPGMLFANNIKLPKDAPQGKYRAVFTVYDKVAKTQFAFEQNFEIK